MFGCLLEPYHLYTNSGIDFKQKLTLGWEIK